jgi:hypothetical protein
MTFCSPLSKVQLLCSLHFHRSRAWWMQICSIRQRPQPRTLTIAWYHHQLRSTDSHRSRKWHLSWHIREILSFYTASKIPKSANRQGTAIGSTLQRFKWSQQSSSHALQSCPLSKQGRSLRDIASLLRTQPQTSGAHRWKITIHL